MARVCFWKFMLVLAIQLLVNTTGVRCGPVKDDTSVVFLLVSISAAILLFVCILVMLLVALKWNDVHQAIQLAQGRIKMSPEYWAKKKIRMERRRLIQKGLLSNYDNVSNNSDNSNKHGDDNDSSSIKEKKKMMKKRQSEVDDPMDTEVQTVAVTVPMTAPSVPNGNDALSSRRNENNDSENVDSCLVPKKNEEQEEEFTIETFILDPVPTPNDLDLDPHPEDKVIDSASPTSDPHVTRSSAVTSPSVSDASVSVTASSAGGLAQEEEAAIATPSTSTIQ